MPISTRKNTAFYIKETVVEEVEEFCYLGIDGGASTDIINRIKKSMQAFGMLRNIRTSNVISVLTKLRLFNTNITSVLFYSYEMWQSTNETDRKLQVFLNKCIRRILPINWFDRVTNKKLLARSNQNEIIVEIKRRKWNWIGSRRNNIARKAFEWNSQSKRKKDRPAITWKHSTMKEIEISGKTWNQIKHLANYRPTWHAFLNVLCSN